jgi:hypothetical protein
MIPLRLDRLLGAIAHPVTEWRVTRAKAACRKASPRCAACCCPKDPVTGKQNDVHHILPVHLRPDLAADPANLVTLCRLHHWLCGHRGVSWKAHNFAVSGTCEKLRKIYLDLFRPPGVP